MENAIVEDWRVQPRTEIAVEATFRQRRTVGTWSVLDISMSGFSSSGELDGLNLAAPVDVRVGRGDRAFTARAIHAWAHGRDRVGAPLHGWAFLDLSQAARDELAWLLRNPPAPVELRLVEAPPADPLMRFFSGILVGLVLALIATVAAWIVLG